MNSDRVHSLADLDTWSAPGPSLAVVGHPVAHSLSPAMHHAALADLSSREPAFSRWRYHKFDIMPEDLHRALPLFHSRGFFGLNLTIPHKVMAVGLVDRIDPDAAASGAVNTLRRFDAGFEGFNTDGHGISRAVEDEFGLQLRGTVVVILGAGGAARAAAVTCLRERCAELWIGNRTASRLEELLKILAPLAREGKVPLRGFQPGAPEVDLPGDALLINATSAGLRPGDPPPIDPAVLPGAPCVYDMVYNPPETPLLRAARAHGLRAANGLSMLAHQGARALEIWTGREVSAAVMLRACRSALGPAGRGADKGSDHP
jgi:shikimate dehydrogenase